MGGYYKLSRTGSVHWISQPPIKTILKAHFRLEHILLHLELTLCVTFCPLVNKRCQHINLVLQLLLNKIEYITTTKNYNYGAVTK